ncbi:MAG: S8 family serine peptidase [Planctomycetota bacterium]
MDKNKFFLSLCALLFCAFLAGRAAETDLAGDTETKGVKDEEFDYEYVPNQLLVKFRLQASGDSEVAEHLEATKHMQETGHPGAGPDGDEAGTVVSKSLGRLKKQFRVLKSEKVFRGFAKHRRKMGELRKKTPGKLTKLQKRLLRRRKRVPVGLQAPDLDRIYLVELEEGQDLATALAAFRQDPAVEYAELNYLQLMHKTPNDPYFSIQWPLENTAQMYPESGTYNHPPGKYDSDIDAPEAWDIFTGSPEVVVAVIDTGVDYVHRDIDDNMWINDAELNGTAGLDDDYNGYVDDIYGYDFFNRDGDPMDDIGHGTHCAGVIAAETDNVKDIAGVCWQTRIMAIKFLGPVGGSTGDAVKSFFYAIANGADICSSSWGGGPYSQTLEETLDYAASQGVILVASAGNDYSSYPTYPANYGPMIAVAATDSNDNKPAFSNYGSWVDIAAPGVDVLSLRSSLAGPSFGTPYDAYTLILSGTSMACPHVAGACALLIGANPTLTRADVYHLLMTTGDPIATGICSSDSRLNIWNMLKEAVFSQGRVEFNQDAYSCSDQISVILADGDLAGQGNQSVIINTSASDSETLNLTERPTGIGVYDGTIATESGAANSGDSIVQVTHGDTVIVMYNDVNDGSGNGAMSVDTATADCVGPVISNVAMGQVGAFWARIQIETDELSRILINYGRSCNNLRSGTGQDLALSLSHNVYLYNLRSETNYYFEVIATDEFGNETSSDNGGQCYSFTTVAQVPGLHVPIEYPTIQAAINAASKGDTVLVADGIYQGQGNRDLDFGGKAITVQSEYGPEFCVIDCQGSVDDPRCGFYFHNEEGPDSVVSGFTITGGYAEYIEYIGGGIVCKESDPTIEDCILSNNVGVFGGGIADINSSPTVTNCQFIGNVAHLMGGGMDNFDNSHPIVTDCTFINNITDSPYSDEFGGGAVGNSAGSYPVFSGCRFEDNFTYGIGAGIYNEHDADSIVVDCDFVNNEGLWGGGAIGDDYGDCDSYVVNSRFYNNWGDLGGAMFIGPNGTLIVVNCLFSRNQAESIGGGIWLRGSSFQVVNSTFYHNEALSWAGGMRVQEAAGDVSNCIFWENKDLDGTSLDAQIFEWMPLGLHYNCIQGWVDIGQSDKDGNIDSDPLFLDADGPDAMAGTEDDNLRPGPGSPCIDAGDNNWVPLDRADLDDDDDLLEQVPLDMDWGPRKVDDPNTPDTGLTGPDPQAPIVDMGAYEGPYQGFRIEPRPVVVPEGSTGTFMVSLGSDPQGPVTVTVGFHSGDVDISVLSGGTLNFDSNNFNVGQMVELSAAEDDDFINGSAKIVVSAAGFPTAKVTALESDNEPVPAVMYVDKAATGNETGLSWTDAFKDLKFTMEITDALSTIPEIRVAQGTYHPADPNGNRKASFSLKSGMVLRGGYAGVQGPNPDARDVQAYQTILSGDLNEDDGPGFVNYQENSYHVVVGRNLDSNTVLDGFVVSGGNADGMYVNTNGGGMLNRNGSNPVIIDCNFSANLSSGGGSGMYNDNSNPHVIRCRFSGNAIGGNSGGGMYNINSSPIVEDCEFVANDAGVGGGMANGESGNARIVNCLFKDNKASFGGGFYSRDNCNPTVIDCTFENNWADFTGGGLELRGGNSSFTRCRIINNDAGESDWGGSGISAFSGTITFESCTVTGNHSYENGGGMFVWSAIVYMENCTISDNTADDMGGGIFLFGHLSGSATLRSCILWNENATEVEGKTISVQYSDIEGGYTGTGNINTDPCFVDTAGGDYHLRWVSSCIDTGDPGYVPQPSDKDIDGEPRVMRANRVDMGSDEVGPKQVDFNRNGIIDGLDLLVLINSWLAVEGDADWYPLCDLHQNKQIDAMDYAEFTGDWGWQAQWYQD